MSRPNHLGTRYVCWKCGAKYYDLNKPSPTCPKCGADPTEAPKIAVAPTPAPKKSRKARAEVEDEVDTDVDDTEPEDDLDEDTDDADDFDDDL